MRKIFLLIICYVLTSQFVYAQGYDTFISPTPGWTRHHYDTYEEGYLEDEGNPCKLSNYDQMSYLCYKGTNPNNEPIEKHCGFGPAGQYGNAEDNQCSGLNKNIIHAAWDFDLPDHEHDSDGNRDNNVVESHIPNDNVVAAASGEIVHVITNGDDDHGFGNTVIIRHYCAVLGSGPLQNCVWEDGYVVIYTQYSHLANFEYAVQEGAWIYQGMKLGNIGGTAQNKADHWITHLHFEVQVTDELVNTCTFVNNEDNGSYNSYGYVNIDNNSMEDCGYRDPGAILGDLVVFRYPEDVQLGGLGGNDLPTDCATSSCESIRSNIRNYILSN